MLAWAALPVTACTSTRTVVEPGEVLFQIRNPVPSNAAPPPPALGNTAQAISPPPTPRSGHYAGYGYDIVGPGGMCAGKIRIYNFIVNGNQITFGAYSGTIRSNGHLEIQGGDTYIVGDFVGAHFEGRYWQPVPACTYTLSLEPVARAAPPRSTRPRPTVVSPRAI